MGLANSYFDVLGQEGMRDYFCRGEGCQEKRKEML